MHKLLCSVCFFPFIVDRHFYSLPKTDGLKG